MVGEGIWKWGGGKGKQVLLRVTHGMCIESRDFGFQNCGCVLKWLTLEATKSVTNPEMLRQIAHYASDVFPQG